MLDPNFRTNALLADLPDNSKQTVIKKITDYIVAQANIHFAAESKISGASATSGEQNDVIQVQQPVRRASLFDRYNTSNAAVSNAGPSSARTELDAYLNQVIAGQAGTIDTLRFWQEARCYKRLRVYAKAILHVPASSAKVERTFSRSGFMMKPTRSRLDESTLSQLVKLSCNRSAFVRN